MRLQDRVLMKLKLSFHAAAMLLFYITQTINLPKACLFKNLQPQVAAMLISPSTFFMCMLHAPTIGYHLDWFRLAQENG